MIDLRNRNKCHAKNSNERHRPCTAKDQANLFCPDLILRQRCRAYVL